MTVIKRSSSGVVWLGVVACGCGGWVDLEPPGGGGSSTSAAGTSSSSAGTQSVPTDAGRGSGGSSTTVGGSGGTGGETLIDAGGVAGSDATGPRFLLLEAPEPRIWPAGVERTELTWSATSRIVAGDLDSGALAGVHENCFKFVPTSSACDFTTQEPFVWTEAAGLRPLDSATTSPLATHFQPTFVTADGQTVVGTYGTPSSAPVRGFFRWTEQTGILSLGTPSDTTSGGPSFVSDDGTVIAGVLKRSKAETSPFLWSVADGLQLLDASQGWPAGAEIAAMSADGGELVATTHGAPRALWRWTADGGAEPLGELPAQPHCALNAVTPSLETIFGNCSVVGEPAGTGFRWTEAEGLLPIHQSGTGTPCEIHLYSLASDGAAGLGVARCGASSSWELMRLNDDGEVEQMGVPVPEFLPTGSARDGQLVFGEAGSQVQPSQLRAATWDGESSLRTLAPLTVGDATRVHDATSLGDLFVGSSGPASSPTAAVLWNGSTGIDIREALLAFGAELNGARLQGASRVRARDGEVLIQGVIDSRQDAGVWFAWLPTP